VTPAHAVVAGIGSVYRRDDGAGPVAAARVAARPGPVRDLGPVDDPLDLLGRWDGCDLAVVVDAVSSGAPPGTIHVLDVGVVAGDSVGVRAGAAPAGAVTTTHGIGLAGVLRLAEAVGRAPRRVVLVGIEGEDFGFGVGLTPAVDAAIPAAVDRIVELIREAEPCA
jgi:hydrogenase maturation protease